MFKNGQNVWFLKCNANFFKDEIYGDKKVGKIVSKLEGGNDYLIEVDGRPCIVNEVNLNKEKVLVFKYRGLKFIRFQNSYDYHCGDIFLTTNGEGDWFVSCDKINVEAESTTKKKAVDSFLNNLKKSIEEQQSILNLFEDKNELQAPH